MLVAGFLRPAEGDFAMERGHFGEEVVNSGSVGFEVGGAGVDIGRDDGEGGSMVGMGVCRYAASLYMPLGRSSS